jgi:hypothetical protein
MLVYEISENAKDASDVFGFNAGCRWSPSLAFRVCPFSEPEDGLCLWPVGSGWMILVGFPALLIGVGEAGAAVEAKDAADALDVNARARLSSESPPEDEGGTARIVDLARGCVGSSRSTSNPFSNSMKSGGGDVGGVLPCEKRRDDGV